PPTATPDSSCDTTSRDIEFAVYANPRDLDIYYPGIELDASAPLNGSTIRFGQTLQRNAQSRFSVPRASLGTAGYQISRDGYWSAQGGDASSLCSRMFVALSPLSAEEQTGQTVMMDAIDLSMVPALPPFMRLDQTTGFSYAVLKDQAAAAPLQEWLDQQPDSASAKDFVTQVLEQGKMIVLFSNNSQQMGDMYSVLQTAIETPKALILATHMSSMIQYPRPQSPFGDIFNKRLEIRALAASDKAVVFDALQAGVGSAKARLEVK
ncbi:MAG: hypothetical protein CVV27_12485, partial [Candidatus Melainabacteria bacterium HGW-Melainabacteria-1]